MTTSGSAGAPPEEYKQQNQEKRPTSNFFPLGYKDALYQWWTSVTPPIAERNVLSFMPHLKEAVDTLKDPSADDKDYPPGTRVWRRELVQLPGKNRALNEVSIERVGEEAEDTLVMVHGYGAGLGFFYKNFEALSRQPGMKLYALDMLGMGNSTRPPFKIHAKTKEEQVIEAENFFIDALEEWRQSRKIERFTLLGHSLGGYLAVSYALKYPGHLKKLILASPVGVPKDPYAVNASMPDPDDQSVAEEFIQEEEAVSPPPKDGTQTKNASGANTPKRPLPSWAVWLWDANVSPFSLIRMAGPLGPRFISGWTSRRFKHLPTPEAEALHDYTFSIFKQKGSGEYALSYILAPGAYARRPVIDRIQHVGRQKLPNSDKKETGFPIVFMYGEQDWMDVAGGLAAEEKLKQTQAKILANATEEEKKAENGSVRVVMIPKAGHHLYLENPDYFNEVMMKELASTRQDDEKRRSHQ
ncbi:Alpha/Beta hydrolase protein [Emericellopsis atlantica]|uniref:Alpha/Beta hydrolase protein n=1 Tax=Emericellopsis atlantica TaxID=2614577 RepID=A0A9P8CTE7_9HYPO|nr:Alpha/Beta hydrolase protein [Emericellopsis atlantica]KAG9259079.1 Alpha/Beta hydrolase protein [Emericellopsis atlantica]